MSVMALTADPQPRKPKGNPDGGQFGAHDRELPEIAVGPSTATLAARARAAVAAWETDVDDENVDAIAEVADVTAAILQTRDGDTVAEARAAAALAAWEADTADENVEAAAELVASLRELVEQPKPFVWNRKHGDFEQVRPYMNEFLTVYDQLKRPEAGFVPDSEFVGRIPSLEGAEPREYERAIYMLQSLRRRDIVAQQVEEFTQAGGREITVHDLTRGQELRGTVVRYGWYVDGTGFQVIENARLRKSSRSGELEYVEKGKRTGVGIYGGKVMLRED